MKKRIFAFLAAFCVLISCFVVPTFADSIDGVTEDDMTYGEFYQVEVNYRPPTYQDQIRVEWQPWSNGFQENELKGAWNSKTQYVYMRVPRDASNNPIGAISIVFEDTNERMWLIRDYSVRFQWWQKEHENGVYEYISEIVFTNYTGPNGDQNLLCFRWSSLDGYGLYDESKDLKIKDLTGFIALYYNPGDMYGVTTYSNGGSWYGLTNWYTAFGHVDEILTPSYYTDVEAEKQVAFDMGYDLGFVDGKFVGGQEAWQDGYDFGVSDALKSDVTMSNMIFTIFDAPFYILTTALDFELFGINIAGTLIGIISLALIVFILKIIIVRLF